jgi:RNA polymerase sigma factor (sigma-70 family)
MAIHHPSAVLRHLHRTVLGDDAAGRSDAQLLGCFVAQRDEAAFELLVRRHGPMVLGVCRRILGDPHDAEDAFQATFLVLVRKAGSVSPPDMLPNWLYGVAYRTAIKARALAARRRAREKQVVSLPEPPPPRAEPWADLRPLLDRELNALPDKYRAPIVLCGLEGKSHQEAARQLGWPVGTVSGRLSRARALLAKRLTRRGVALSAATAGAVAASAAPAAVPVPLVAATVRAAGLFAAGPAAAIPAPITALTEGVIRSMFLAKLTRLSALLLFVVTLTAGAGVMLTASGADDPRAPDKKAEPPAGAPPEAARNKTGPAALLEERMPGVINAADIAQVFRTNEALADEKIRNKRVSVRGWVIRVKRAGIGKDGILYDLLLATDIRRSPQGNVITGLATDAILSFRFSEKSRKELAKLRPAQAVVVEGRCETFGPREERGQDTVFFFDSKLVEDEPMTQPFRPRPASPSAPGPKGS